MPLEVMMSLGRYRFSIATAAYQTLTRSASWRWPAQERLGSYPVRQYVGPGESTISFDGIVYPHYKGLLGLPNLLARVPVLPAALGVAAGINSALGRVGLSLPGLGGRSGTWTLHDLWVDGEQGRPLLLVDGRGRIWGHWCLLTLEERETRHLADGSALSIAFSAQLGYYGDKSPDAIQADKGLMANARGILGI